ncbi:MAG: Asp-tRNA(Asn)/Glu-tRNA(Gln) amidotransferase subunit GatC [Pseudomonadota bacterium]
MAVSNDEVADIAHLARLAIDAADVPVYAERLSRVLDLADDLSEIDTDALEPMAHPLDGTVQRLRDDAVTEPEQREAFQAQAPAVERGLYLVPRVVE